jgi:asparagine synthase (glutamine-hydrolysing)
MTSRLRHRGPDDEGFFCRGPIALGHRRLSVVDLSAAGRQPMGDAAGRYWIVFNGEIYNFRELRGELESEGIAFTSRSDTEVILAAYRRWNFDCLSRLNGMFAFAIWDALDERLFLARDRAGEKPLFYHVSGDGLAFASDLSGLLASDAVRPRVSPAGLGQFLAFGYTVGAASLVDGVQRLEPAHALVVERDRPLRTWRYWDLAAAYRAKATIASEDEAAEALAALVDDSVRLRLVSDVPLGAFLSGGLDSSTVVAAMRRHISGARAHTFSIAFEEPSFDESAVARRVAAALGVVHDDQAVQPDMSVELPRIAAFLDEPLADTSTIPTYYLSAFARRQVTVCLSGDGGDENFAGYPTYVADRLRALGGWLPRPLTRGLARAAAMLLPVRLSKVGTAEKLRRFLGGLAREPRRAHAGWRELIDAEQRQAILRPEVQRSLDGCDPFGFFDARFDEVRGCHFLDQALYVDTKTWLCDDVLVKVDRMTMAHSLEARAPFLDHRIMEFAASLPPQWKLHGFRGKHALKRSQRRTLPAEVIARAKQGFNAPISRWFNGPLEEIGRRAFADGALGEWFEPLAVERLWTEHRSGRADHGLALFALTGLGLWRARVGASL